MGFLDNLTEIATDLAQSGAAASKHLAETSIATSKRLAEIAKLKTSNLAEEGSIKKAYAELGRLYYAEHGNTPEGAYAAACERITVSRELIQANNDRIAELKSAAEAEGEVIVFPRRPLPLRKPPLSKRPPPSWRPLPLRRRIPLRRPSPRLNPIRYRDGRSYDGSVRFFVCFSLSPSKLRAEVFDLKQYFRLPQDVVGHDAQLLSYWDTLPPSVQLRLLESTISVSTLGELKLLEEGFRREPPSPT